MGVNKTTLKSVVVVTVGVLIAGFVLNQMRGNQIVDQMRGGFNN